MRAAGLLLIIAAGAACRIERITPPPRGGSRAAPVAGPEDSAITAALASYYDRFSRRAWGEFRESFWPGAVIATRWRPPDGAATVVDVIPLDTFVARTRDGPDRLAVFDERMVYREIRRYGDLASVWTTFRATFGEPGREPVTHHGVDAFQLLKHGGQWRIVSLSFTPERPGDSLPRDAERP